MQTRKDILGVACESLNRLFSINSNQLVRQALESDLVSYLLELLDSNLEVENPAMTKAQIVKALKAMAKSVLYGERVLNILEKSRVWAEYKDQKHDLFITNTTHGGYLTGLCCLHFTRVILFEVFILHLDYKPYVIVQRFN